MTGYGQALLVWERFGYPEFLTAEGEELIAGQYADRPQLRPILDAVRAALPAAGPAAVQARKTFVSLVTPRRTFAVVQAATKSRVDLGLRLDQENPGGRLVTERCGCSAVPSSGSSTSIPAWSRKPCAPSTGWSHESG